MSTMPVRSYNTYALTPKKRSAGPMLLFLGLLIGAIVGAVLVARRMLEHKSGDGKTTLPVAKGTTAKPAAPVAPVAPAPPGPGKPIGKPPKHVAAVPDAGTAVAVIDHTPPPDHGSPVVTHPIDAPPQAGPCPAGAKLDGHLCIDVYEATAQSQLPATGMSWGDARKACSTRGMRLCKAHEWEAACRGAHGASYPYGASFQAPRCNVERSGTGKLMKPGSFPECVSAAGLSDMAGNVAEWVDEGYTKGGSWEHGDGRCSKADHPARDEGHEDVGYRCCATPK
jgi:hypothetical protein